MEVSRKKLNLIFLIFVFLIFNHTFFMVGLNPIGFYYLNEIFTLFLLLFSIMLMVGSISKNKLSFYDVLFFLIPAFMVVHSSLSALLYYDQPFYMGLIESRRVLYMMNVLVILYFFLKFEFSVSCLVKAYVFSVILMCSIFLFSRLMGVVPYRGDDAGLLTDMGYSSWRITAGQLCVVIGFFVLYTYRLEFGRLYVPVAIFFSLYLAFVVQSRQILLGVFVVVLFSYLFSSVYSYRSKILVIGVLPIAVYFSISGSDYLSDVLLRTTPEEMLNFEDARSWSFFYALEDIEFLGRGAISLMYDSGYSSIYHDNFYLIDIGVIGTLYRFGFIAILYYLIFFVFSVWLYRRVGPKERVLLGMTLAFMLLLLPTSAPLEYYFYGYYFVFSLLIYQVLRGGDGAYNSNTDI